MGYYVHNKYDKASIDGLSTTGAGQTLVDYYGEYETYKYLDTSKGFGVVYDTLSYITPGEIVNGATADNDGSYFNFSSSIIVKSIQVGTATATTGGVTVTLPVTVDPSKSIVLIDSRTTTNVTMDAFNPGSIKFSAAASSKFSYQVLEYK